jgi:hypothetical protein
MILNVWNTHIILTSKLLIDDVNTCGTSRWHINIGNTYCSGLWIIQIFIIYIYVANVKICTYGTYGSNGTHVFYGI